jgi:hypothetical protein
LLVTALSGCADYQAQQRAKAAAQLNEQYKAALQECKNKIPTVRPQNVVTATQCSNAAVAILLPTYGSNQDLTQTFMAQPLAIAQQVQSGKITAAEGAAASRPTKGS